MVKIFMDARPCITESFTSAGALRRWEFFITMENYVSKC